MGSKRRPFYRIIATDSRNPRDGRFIETLGYYDPMKDPADVKVKEDLLFEWMRRGAQPTDNTERILRNIGVMKKWSLLKQGVSAEELEAKYEELKSTETPPMAPAEREKKAAAKKAAAEAETAEVPEAADSAPEPESGKAEEPGTKPAAEPEAGATEQPETETAAKPGTEPVGSPEAEKTDAEAQQASEEEEKKES
jgi:small subunit ribosomal protein S16